MPQSAAAGTDVQYPCTQKTYTPAHLQGGGNATKGAKRGRHAGGLNGRQVTPMTVEALGARCVCVCVRVYLSAYLVRKSIEDPNLHAFPGTHPPAAARFACSGPAGPITACTCTSSMHIQSSLFFFSCLRLRPAVSALLQKTPNCMRRLHSLLCTTRSCDTLLQFCAPHWVAGGCRCARTPGWSGLMSVPEEAWSPAAAAAAAHGALQQV